jgi:hypothetical protein
VDAGAGWVRLLVAVDRDAVQLAHVRPKVRIVPVADQQLAEGQLVLRAALAAILANAYQGKHALIRF